MGPSDPPSDEKHHTARIADEEEKRTIDDERRGADASTRWLDASTPMTAVAAATDLLVDVDDGGADVVNVERLGIVMPEKSATGGPSDEGVDHAKGLNPSEEFVPSQNGTSAGQSRRAS
jgi:hypothetical protein